MRDVEAGAQDEQRADLVRMVEFVKAGMPGLTEAEGDAYIESLEAAVLHPRVTDLIFWPQREFDHEPTAEEIVDRALSYRPFIL